MEGWKDGRMEGWRDGGMEGWRDGGMDVWRDGGMEAWREGREGLREGRKKGSKEGREGRREEGKKRNGKEVRNICSIIMHTTSPCAEVCVAMVLLAVPGNAKVLLAISTPPAHRRRASGKCAYSRPLWLAWSARHQT